LQPHPLAAILSVTLLTAAEFCTARGIHVELVEGQVRDMPITFPKQGKNLYAYRLSSG